MTDMTFGRLQRIVFPTRYDLNLRPDLKEFTFDGSVQIGIKVAVCTNRVTVHALDLDITCAQLQSEEDPPDIQIPIITLNTTDETVTFDFAKSLSNTFTGILDISFKGILNDYLIGFYRSKYVDQHGVDQYEAVTQFETRWARRCFPCFDEPNFKATFHLTVTTDVCFTVLSNMPISDRNVDNDLQVVAFQTTPLMSTYLLAIVIGEYEFLEIQTESEVKIRVYTPIGKTNHGQFALDISKKILEYYESRFEICYPLPKLDHVAVYDFAPGAMENWGLIIYRQSTLLVDPDKSGDAIKKHITKVIGHEIAHMWFGNLVTMNWWTDIWLNEGFATFVEFMLCVHLHPHQDIQPDFINIILNVAFELDALRISHAIELPPGDPNENAATFDRLAFSKGCSLIRMVYHYVGETDFLRSINRYLDRYQYSNVTNANLWEAFVEICLKPIDVIMSTWTTQTGYPILTVEEKQENCDRVLTLTQTRFYADGKSDDTSNLWKIPLTVCTSKEPDQVVLSVMLEDQSVEVVVGNLNEDDWVKLNSKTVGYYRVLYPDNCYEKFKRSILDQTMTPLDRIGLLYDTFSITKAGFKPTTLILDLMLSLVNDTHYAVWTCLAKIINQLDVLLSHRQVEYFSNYVQHLLANIYKKVGWEKAEDETDLDERLRATVLELLVKHNQSDAIDICFTRFKCILNESSETSGDLRNVIYRAVSKYGTEEDIDQMINLYKESNSEEEQSRILQFIGSTNNKDLLQKVLQFCMSEEVRKQNFPSCLRSIVATPLGMELAWNFFKENFETFKNRYPSGSFSMDVIVELVTNNFATTAHAEEIEQFFTANPVVGAEHIVSQSIENIYINEVWLQRDYPSIETFLKSFAT